ncbi:MAG: bactofilin family protein [Armatimonadota bacterium]
MMKKIIFSLVMLLSLLVGSVISAPIISDTVADPTAAPLNPEITVQSDNDIVKVGQDITIKAGETVRNVTTVRGDITIKGHVTESVIAVLGDIHVTSGGVVDGDVFTIRGNITKEPGAVIHGKQSMSGNMEKAKPHTAFPFIGFLLLSLFVVVLVTVFFPQRMQVISDVIQDRPGWSWVNGMFASFLIVPIAIMLLVTIIGIPIIVVEVLLVALLWIVGKVAVDYALGKRLSSTINRPINSIVVAAIIGEILLSLISLLPILGGILVYMITVIGFGAVITTGFGKDKRWLVNYFKKWTKKLPEDIPGDESSIIDGN